MLRPPPPFPELEPESHDSGSFGGLADVLEPDPDATSVSMRRLGPPSSRLGPPSSRSAGYIGGQAVSSPPPVSIRAPVQIQDFAFADTVFANELDNDPESPPSLPISFDEPSSSTQCVTPLAFPLPDAAKDVDLSTRLRVLSARLRHSQRRAVEEMRELWGDTAAIVDDGASGEGGPKTTPSFLFFLRRIVAIWSCFQWSLTDLTRAAIIGSVVFLVAGAIGATVLDFTLDVGTGGTRSPEVRAAHTLEQHTARKIVLRNKR